MHNILHIDASIFGENGQSAKLTRRLVDGFSALHTNAQVTHRNLGVDALPHLDLATIGAIGKGEAELADTLIAEIQAADTVVIGAPMYNFSVPTQLKAWFDHITRAKVTFEYGPNGPVGLLTGKKVVVVTTGGGQHVGTPRDGVTPWLKTILWFLGLDEDLQFIQLEGLSQSALKKAAEQKGNEEVDALIASLQKEEAVS